MEEKQMIQIKQELPEKVYLVGLDKNKNEMIEHSMGELGALAQACGMEVVGRTVQRLESVNKAYYIGPGKVQEVKSAAQVVHANLVLFNDSLSPSQLRNLQDELQMPVMDRSSLILDIFAMRAKTREAKLQVETARLQYMLPRLVGLHDALSRQGGASGAMSSRGAGEKKLELDRRILEKRLVELHRELSTISQERKTQRKKRANAGIPRVALVGYTNAGKSTLMNALLELGCVPDQNIEEKKVFEKDMLFATLDTTVREISISGHQPFLLSDTVGFVDRLPHLLVEAFHSTLEEAAEADLLLQVVDDSDPHAQEQIEVTNKTLKDLGVEEIPMILIYNKADINRGQENLPILKQIGEEQHCIYLSAKEKTGLKELLDLMEQILSSEYADCIFLIPYQEGTITSYLNEHAVVRETEYLPEGIRISVHCLRTDQQRYSRYLAETL